MTGNSNERKGKQSDLSPQVLN